MTYIHAHGDVFGFIYDDPDEEGVLYRVGYMSIILSWPDDKERDCDVLFQQAVAKAQEFGLENYVEADSDTSYVSFDEVDSTKIWRVTGRLVHTYGPARAAGTPVDPSKTQEQIVIVDTFVQADDVDGAIAELLYTVGSAKHDDVYYDYDDEWDIVELKAEKV